MKTFLLIPILSLYIPFYFYFDEKIVSKDCFLQFVPSLQVLKWFDNPYLIRQEPNFEAFEDARNGKNLHNIIDQTKNTLDDTVSEKKVPNLKGLSISDNFAAFHRSVNNLATLAYATEADAYTSTEDAILSSRFSQENIIEDDVQSSTETNLGIWRLIVSPDSDFAKSTSSQNNIKDGISTIFYPGRNDVNTEKPVKTKEALKAVPAAFQSTNPKFETTPIFTEAPIKTKDKTPAFKTSQQKFATPEPPAKTTTEIQSFFGKFITTETPIQVKKLVEKPLEVPTVKPKILRDVGFFEPITTDPVYNYIWTDVDKPSSSEELYYEYDYNEDDLRDPDMTTIGIGSNFNGGFTPTSITSQQFNGGFTPTSITSQQFNGEFTPTSITSQQFNPDFTPSSITSQQFSNGNGVTSQNNGGFTPISVTNQSPKNGRVGKVVNDRQKDTGGVASSAILNDKNFPFPTLEPGFDILSDDWFQVNGTDVQGK